MRRGRLPIPGTFEDGYEPPRISDLAKYRLPGTDSVVKAMVMGEARILMGREPAGANGELLWHLSISCENRHPSWDEIKTARYRLLPHDLTFGMLLPPPELYVNVPEQNHVFHLWEITDPREPWSGG